jgi:hypothetical protein
MQGRCYPFGQLGALGSRRRNPVVHAALGQKGQAFAYLDKAYEMRADCIAFLKVEPRADPLRSDARFQRLLQRVKLSR